MSMPIYSDRQDKIAISDLVRELFAKISEYINTQIKLTKTEIKVEGRKLAVAAVFGVVALIVGFVSVLFLGMSLILLLDKVMDLAWASVATTVIFLVITGLFAWMMTQEIQKNSETIELE